MIEVRERTPADEAWVRQTLEDGWGSTTVARLGEAVDALALDGYIATVDGVNAGLVTYRLVDNEVEVVTLQSTKEGVGVGRALLDAVERAATAANADRLWLITTDNNQRATWIYERWGMFRIEIHIDAVAASRLVKPSIPFEDAAGRPLRDEWEYELTLPR